ncbi:SymE family type I addiction module toxin [Winslowiella toletana]|uniref:SymE family type I addiction module toxin n=1 Tax=Winslowiella toletana TaxID=92490 RepID=UPI0023EA5516|nr:SymE family type I addiction module toxin [Winslowiella toletana]
MNYVRRHPDYTPVPALTLKGHRLAAAVFNTELSVDVRVMAGCLVITARQMDLNEPEFILSLRKLSVRKQRLVKEFIGVIAGKCTR